MTEERRLDVEKSNNIALRKKKGREAAFTCLSIKITMARVSAVLFFVNCLSLNILECVWKSLCAKKRCLLSELAILVPSTVKMSITPLLACSLSGFGCFLITRWQVDAELCFPDPAAFSRICPGNSKSCSFVCYEELPWFLLSSW